MLLPLLVTIFISFTAGSYVGSNSDVAGSLEQQRALLFNQVNRSVYRVEVASGAGWGTGFTVKADSGNLFVITNAHVCVGGPVFSLYDSKGNKTKTNIVEVSDKHDICLLEAPKGARPLVLAEQVYKNSKAYAVGYPLSGAVMMGDGYIRATTKFIHPMNEIPLAACDFGAFHVRVDPMGNAHCIYEDAALITTITYDQGGSGSPVVNSEGEVLGVVNIVIGRASWATAVTRSAIKDLLSSH